MRTKRSGARVALVGSSGGGGATSGHGDAAAFVSEVGELLREAGLELAAVQLVATCDGSGLDQAADATPAYLLTLGGAAPTRTASQSWRCERLDGSLAAVNAAARAVDMWLGELIARGEVNAVMSVSADVLGVNRAALSAAVARQLPIAASGGSSLSALAAQGGRVVQGGGGSVATTRFLRSACLARAACAGLGVEPMLAAPAHAAAPDRSTLCSLVPAFVTAALLRGAAQALPALPGLGAAAEAAGRSLPTLLCAALVVERAGSALGAPAIMAGVMAGSACPGLLAAWVAGRAVTWMLPRVLLWLVGRGWVPGTACAVFAVVAAVASGVAAALLWQHALGDAAAAAQAWLAGEHPAWLGALVSALLCYGSKRGYYHLVALPIILLEMEHGHLSWIGAMDACALCAVSAGICAAAALRRNGEHHAREGLRVNIMFGDLVEACYPYCEKDRVVSLGGYAGAMLSGALLAPARCHATAYVPLPLAAALSSDPLQTALALAVAFTVPFAVTLVRIT